VTSNTETSCALVKVEEEEEGKKGRGRVVREILERRRRSPHLSQQYHRKCPEDWRSLGNRCQRKVCQSDE